MTNPGVTVTNTSVTVKNTSVTVTFLRVTVTPMASKSTSAKRQTRLRDLRAQAGLVAVTVWVQAEQAQQIRDLAETLLPQYHRDAMVAKVRPPKIINEIGDDKLFADDGGPYEPTDFTDA